MERRHFLLASMVGLAALSTGGLAACSGTKSAEAKERRSTVPRLVPEAAAAGPAKALAAANAEFAWALDAQLPRDGNSFFSPYSVVVAMGMVYAGAKGDTAAALAKALRFDGLGTDVHAAFNALDAALVKQRAAGAFQLSVANSSWAQSGFPFTDAYLETLARYYGAGLWLADFEHAPESARGAINGWVEKQTNERIKDLLPKGSVTNLTRLVLANAIYFKADWAKTFKKESTRPRPFTKAGGSRVDVPMMSQTESFAYASAGGVQALELPYQDNGIGMVILLPERDANVSLDTVLAASPPLIAALKPARVAVTIPKWEFTSAFSLKEALTAMGAGPAFDSSAADLSGMDGRKDLFVSDVFHKAFVRVDEKGTEAAAASAAVIGVTSAPIQQQPIEFTADHPFAFLIRERETGAVLFAGRVTDPAA